MVLHCIRLLKTATGGSSFRNHQSRNRWLHLPKPPNSLETLQIGLELLRRIPKGRSVTAPQLKRQLAEAGIDRDIRTIERQLETLSGHFGINRDESSKPYRYCWDERIRQSNRIC